MEQNKPVHWTPGALTLEDGTRLVSKDDITWTKPEVTPATNMVHMFMSGGQTVALFEDGHWSGDIPGLPLKADQIDLKEGRVVAKDGCLFLSVDGTHWWPLAQKEPTKKYRVQVNGVIYVTHSIEVEAENEDAAMEMAVATITRETSAWEMEDRVVMQVEAEFAEPCE